MTKQDTSKPKEHRKAEEEDTIILPSWLDCASCDEQERCPVPKDAEEYHWVLCVLNR